MAQPMSGKSSTPIARSNAPVSIFAEEPTKMTKQPKPAKTNKPAADTTPVAATPVAAPVAKPTKVAKPAKVAAPTQSPLERVVAAQAKHVDNAIARMFARKVADLVTAGMATPDAVTKVVGAVQTDTADALVELEGTSGTPKNGVLCHFFNRTQTRLAAGQEPADALEGAFAGYAALALALLPTVPAKAPKPPKPAPAAKAAKPAKAPIGEVAAEQVERLHALAEAAAADQDADAKAAEFTAEQPAN